MDITLAISTLRTLARNFEMNSLTEEAEVYAAAAKLLDTAAQDITIEHSEAASPLHARAWEEVAKLLNIAL